MALGINFSPVPAININHGITKALMMFPRLWVNDQKCELMISASRNYRKKWDSNRLDWMNEPFHDWSSHFVDTLRHIALTEDQMKNEAQQPMPDQEDPNEDVH